MDDLTRLPDPAGGRSAARRLQPSVPTDVATGGRDLTPGSPERGRFAPGAIFAGSFRGVATLGMGEAYRADDLKLAQTVALKLLLERFARGPVRLAQFHNAIAGLSMYGFYASRGDEPLFGRTLLD